jgi:hypothetical protein
MTENYLRFRGIQATEELAKSPNAKTLIFGSGPSGLPLVLGNAVENAPPGAMGGTTVQDPLKQPMMQPTNDAQTKRDAQIKREAVTQDAAAKDAPAQESPTREPSAPATAPVKK